MMMTMRSSLTDVVEEKSDFLIMMFGAVCESGAVAAVIAAIWKHALSYDDLAVG